MKKILTIIAAMLLCIAVQAQGYQLRTAIRKFISDPKLESVSSSDRKGVEIVNGEKRQWSCTQYIFRNPISNSKPIDAIFNAYAKDRDDRRTMLAMWEAVESRTYSVRFTNQLPPVVLGSPTKGRNVVFVSGEEREGINTVIALDYALDEEDLDIISGSIYIIERHPSFQEIAATEEKAKQEQQLDFIGMGLGMINDAINETSENVRRLYFYSQKYENDAQNGGGSAIVKATVFVVSDIIQSGTEEDKSSARFIIDNMIMATPDPSNTVHPEKKAALQENAKTLLNLLSRLDAKSEYSSMQSTPQTFRINGMIDDELWDIGYYISMSDNTMGDPTQDVELVKAEGQTFHYQTELDGIRHGRVRALMKDGTVCSAWIDMLFVPGETAELHVHNGYYSLSGTGFYSQFNNTKKYLSDKAQQIMTEEEKRMKADKKNYKPSITGKDDIALQMLAEHASEPGVFYYVFRENILPPDPAIRQKAYALLSTDLKQSAYGVFFRTLLNQR